MLSVASRADGFTSEESMTFRVGSSTGKGEEGEIMERANGACAKVGRGPYQGCIQEGQKRKEGKEDMML